MSPPGMESRTVKTIMLQRNCTHIMNEFETLIVSYFSYNINTIMCKRCKINKLCYAFYKQTSSPEIGARRLAVLITRFSRTSLDAV